MKEFAEGYISIFNDKPKNVLEIGTRDGHDANYLKEYFDIADNNVFLVEPNPSQVKKIRLKYPNYKLFEFAISQQTGILSFNSIDTDDEKLIGMSSLLTMKKDVDFYEKKELIKCEKWIKVLSISGKMLLDLINEPIYDIVKIDVEGATFSVLRSFGEDIKRIKYVHLEAERIPIWENEVTYDVIYKYMESMGFREHYRHEYTLGQCDTIWYKK